MTVNPRKASLPCKEHLTTKHVKYTYKYFTNTNNKYKFRSRVGHNHQEYIKGLRQKVLNRNTVLYSILKRGEYRKMGEVLNYPFKIVVVGDSSKSKIV